MASTKRCSAATRAGRLAKARQFELAAETIATVVDHKAIADAYVTLCVHAGIAASDVICCARLDEHHQGEDHQAAVTLLAKVEKTAAKHLKTLLDLKTRSGYGATLTSSTDQKRAGRAAAAWYTPPKRSSRAVPQSTLPGAVGSRPRPGGGIFASAALLPR